MPRPEIIVINTSPLITLVAALGNLTVLRSLYTEVLVPFEVCQEITAGGRDGFAVAEFEAANWLHKKDTYLNISPFLLNSLDLGEAAVIQLALDENIQTVCIDEAVGRRIARLNGLSLTGSMVVSQIINKAKIFDRRSSNLSCYCEDLINERDLSHYITFFHILDLSLTNHVHRFVAFDRSSG